MVNKTKNSSKISPVRQQYLDIKSKYPNAILFFRLGDFYETFDQDAEIVSRELDIVLTSRNVSKGNRVPMAGVPHHAAETYIARLIERGMHVAICDQVGLEPVNGLMPREVVRVITPGTLLEAGLLPGDANNYLLALVMLEDSVGIAYADVSTGEFAATELDGTPALMAEIGRLSPAEILAPDDLGELDAFQDRCTDWPAWRFELGRASESMKSHFQSSTLDGFGLKGKPLATRAAGALIQYLQETQSSSLGLVSSFSVYSLDEFMVLDLATRRNLELSASIRNGELEGSLLGDLDRCVTPMGHRLLRQWVNKPLLDISQIRLRQDGVEYFFNDGLLRSELRAALKPLADLERLSNRLLGSSTQPRDLLALRETLLKLPDLIALLPKGRGPLKLLLKGLKSNEKELRYLQISLADDPPSRLGRIGIIQPGFSKELDEVLASTKDARDWIANLESVERARTGIKALKVGFNKVHGYYIEITKAHANEAPEEYIRKQTLVNAERYITPEMKEVETQVLNAEENILQVESRLFQQICAELGKSSRQLLGTARALAALDVLANLAELAALEGFVRPELVEEKVLEIRDGRHLVVERNLPAGSHFVPNDTIFDEGERVRIITGPNMSGKSTYLRQVALIVLMAQMGAFVPVSSARIGLVDRIFTRIGAHDEIHAGQSTFMVEMVEMANILNHATNRSLLILDEIGRGTSTYDGLSIAWAVVEYIHNHTRLQTNTLFSTHFHELTQLSDLLHGVRNYNVAVSEADGQVVFLHKIIEGGADRSYGIHVGQLAGLPKVVVQRAQEILEELEASSKKSKEERQFSARQAALFPESSPIMDELEKLDIDSMAPLEALNKLFEWKKRFTKDEGED